MLALVHSTSTSKGSVRVLPLLPKRAASRDFVHSWGGFTLTAAAWGPRVRVDGLRTHSLPPLCGVPSGNHLGSLAIFPCWEAAGSGPRFGELPVLGSRSGGICRGFSRACGFGGPFAINMGKCGSDAVWLKQAVGCCLPSVGWGIAQRRREYRST